MRNRIVLLAVVIGLLVGVAGIGLLVVTDEDDGTSVAADLPKLPIGAFGERAMAAADSMLAGPVEWRVRGELPDLDDHATAYELRPPSAAAKERLLAAFPDDLSVRVAPDGSWNGPAYDLDDCTVTTREGPPDAPVACSSASSGVAIAVACAPDQPCQPPPPPVDLPSESEAKEIALRTLERAGIDTSGSVQVHGPADGWNITVEPRLDGRRVVGLGTNVQIGSKGKITAAGGRVFTSDAIGDYHLVTTAKGFERLKDQWGPGPGVLRGGPDPAIAIAPGEPVPDDRMPEPPQPIVRTITGVTLGLQLMFGGDSGYLVPVFLFETDDEGGPIPVLAVVDELLQQPGGGGTPEPAPVPVPGEPGQVDPAPPSDGGGTGGSTGSSEACVGSASGSSVGGDPNQPLAIEVCASPSNPKVGETVTFYLKASDPDAAIDANGCQQPKAAFGDETEGSVSCLSLCQKENPPPESTTLGRTFTHAYAKPGTYTAVLTADSCAPKASHGQVELQITVRP